MKTPAFWQAGHGGWRMALLSPLGAIYGRMTLARIAREGWRAPIPVVSVGNFTAGGAGKTPTTLALAQLLRLQGHAPAVLTRGYGGSAAGPLCVDPTRHMAAEVGDEALLLARHVPTYVTRDRVSGAKLAIQNGADCLLLDDALQNPALEKTLSIAVVDGGFGIGNGACLPAGPMRAPLDAMVPYVDLTLVIGEDRHGLAPRLAAFGPVFTARLEPQTGLSLLGQKVIAFAGIGRPEKFFETVSALGATLVGTRAFPDHHAFSEADAAALLAEAEASGARLVTTEKDAVRLSGGPMRDRLAAEARAIPVQLVAESGFLDAVVHVLLAAFNRLSTAAGPE